jgi:hypothetical protein
MTVHMAYIGWVGFAVGATFILAAVIGCGIRAKWLWFYCLLAAASLIIVIPVGTAIAAVLIIYLVAIRRDWGFQKNA